MNPNRPRKPAPWWITAEWKNKARKPRNAQPRAVREDRIKELKGLITDFDIPFSDREKLAKELLVLINKEKNSS